jgi:hypothetical protein
VAAPTLPEPQAPAAKTLKALLEETDFMYKALNAGGTKFRIAVESQDGVGMVVAEEIEMPWKNPDGTPVKIIYMYRWLVSVPEGFEPPPQLLAKLNDINVEYMVGKTLLNKYGMFRCNSIWLRSADAQSLADEVSLLHGDGLVLEKELKPFLSEAAQETSAVAATPSISRETRP